MNVPKARRLSSGKWFIQLRLGGESVPVTASTERDCTKQAELIKAEYRNGKRTTVTTGSKLTLRAAMENYISARSNTLSPATIRGYETIKRNRFQSVIDKPIKDVTDWQAICNREAKTCSPKTLSNSWLFVVSVLKEATGQLPPRVSLPQVVQVERPYLDPDQILDFIKAVKGKKCEVPALLALHSLRRSEICALTWEQIDLKNGRIKVSGALVPDANHKFVAKKANKNKPSQRYVPIMIPELRELLEGAESKTGAIVTCNPNALSRQINAACEAANLPAVAVHGLRHSFASLAYHLNVPERIAMQIGGWADRKTMHDIYTHIGQRDIAKHETEMTAFFKNANKNASG